MIEAGAILQGHFVLASGEHGDTYVNKDAIYPDSDRISGLCRELALFFSQTWQLGALQSAVIAPAVGGVILSQWIAYHLNSQLSPIKPGERVLSLYADKGDDGTFIIKRGYEKLIP